MADSLSPGKLLASDQRIEAAIMKHGFTFSSSIAITSGSDRHTATETSVWKNVLKNGTSVKYKRPFAFVVNAQPLAHPWVPCVHLLTITK